MMMVISSLIFTSCNKDHTCTDGEQNQGELGIDCGGPCDACVIIPQTCNDNIQNQTETGVDCGGPCPPCGITGGPTCTDGIMNGTETGVDCGGDDCPACDPVAGSNFSATINGEEWEAPMADAVVNSGVIRIQGADAAAGRSVVLAHDGAFETGTYPLLAGVTLFNDNSLQPTEAVVCQLLDSANGSITFTTFDTGSQTVSGTFSFTCTDASGILTGDGILSGQFSNISY